MEYTRLFTPIKINGLTIKNRLVQAPIHMVYCPDGKCNEKFTEYYRARAKGGVGAMVVGGCRFDDYGYSGGMMSLHNDDFIPSWTEFVNEMHKEAPDMAVFVQLYQSGGYARQSNIGRQAIGPSTVMHKYTGEETREMTVEEIHQVAKDWAAGAVRAKKCGFDGVEILGSAGYLICQFLSPITNLRTDEYGGSWENRCRFPLEVIKAVREAVGPDYPVSIRIAGNDFMPNSNTNEDAVKFAVLAEEAGVDAINVTGGWHESIVPQITADVPRGGYSYLAANVKAAVKIPVVASNRNNIPANAEEILAMGRADLIALGRPLIADPEYPNKAKAGVVDEIKTCLGCNQGCLAKTFFGKPVECLVNGFTGREYQFKEVKAPTEKKNLLVIGAGPAGCEFAIEATKRGHKVTIWEKEDRIGGQVNIAKVPPAKDEFQTIIDRHKTMIAKLKIDLVLGKEATAEEIAAAGFDEVVIATGSVPRIFEFANSGNIPVYTSDEVLNGDVMPGKDIVIVGGGAVGCELAEYLADRASFSADQLKFTLAQKAETIDVALGLLNRCDRNITIVEVLKKIGNGFDPGCAGPVLREISRLKVKKYPFSTVKDIKANEVVITESKPEEAARDIAIPCDTVILATGRTSSNELVDALNTMNIKVHTIGDAVKVGKVYDAIHQAIDLAYSI